MTTGNLTVEGGAAVDGAFGPDATTVAFDDPPNGGQADAGAGKLLSCVQPLSSRYAQEAMDIRWTTYPLGGINGVRPVDGRRLPER
jgi:hypothetical protein